MLKNAGAAVAGIKLLLLLQKKGATTDSRHEHTKPRTNRRTHPPSHQSNQRPNSPAHPQRSVPKHCCMIILRWRNTRNTTFVLTKTKQADKKCNTQKQLRTKETQQIISVTERGTTRIYPFSFFYRGLGFSKQHIYILD